MGYVIKIVSGGQTGVDRAALDAAMRLGLPVGGWCPKGRKAMDGRIDAAYPLSETPSARYAQRTAWNVRDTQATLILASGSLFAGTALTAAWAWRYRRPLWVIDLRHPAAPGQLAQALLCHRVQVLNVAGPREEDVIGIQKSADAYLSVLFSCIA
jgi:hypothetical protein